jgi:hypothetical protein
MALIFVMKDLKIIPTIRLMYGDHSHGLFTILKRTARQADHIAHLRTEKHVKFWYEKLKRRYLSEEWRTFLK